MSVPTSASPPNGTLRRVVGVPGAVFMGLGSILGTGIFVSFGLAAEAAGSTVVFAVALAALVATFNGLSSAQLAASHPVSGGTYEYGYRYLNPTFGFLAGWMFMSAKSASAATAALGLAGYLLGLFGQTPTGVAHTALAALAVVALTALVAGGIKRSNQVNVVIVSLTLVGLVVFVVAGAILLFEGAAHLAGPPDLSDHRGAAGLLEATALMFVAYTGYGRIATLGEEVRDPTRSIPRAIVMALLVTMVLYVVVVLVAVGVLGAQELGAITRAGAAPLEAAAAHLGVPAVATIISIAAITAMAGVLLNLLLGLSRVLLAMGRRRDVPRHLAQVTPEGSPRAAVIVTGVIILALALTGSVRTTWSFSAFTVLVYYAITNLAALRLPAEARRFPRIVPALGLVSCLGLAFWVEPTIWLVGLGLIAAGLVWHVAAQRLAAR